VAQGRLATVPEVKDMHQTFVPPVEQSPVIYQIVLDLEIPNADHCVSSLQAIESLVDEYMHKTTVPVVKLPTINIATNPTATGGSPNCAQVAGATLPATDMADAVWQTVTSFPETHQQFHFLYFNNQSFLLPTTLTDSLKALFNGLMVAPPPYDLRTFSWLFNPGPAAVTGPNWSMSTPWLGQAADDPTLETALAMYVTQNLPYTSQTYDQSVPVPLLSPADAVTYDGGYFKICASTPRVQAAYTAPPERLSGYGYGYGGWAWEIKASDPPGYFVNLPQVISAPGPSFTRASASVRFQVCTAYCDHPFEATNGTGATSWMASPLCAELP
jgi:hypothetical protein